VLSLTRERTRPLRPPHRPCSKRHNYFVSEPNLDLDTAVDTVAVDTLLLLLLLELAADVDNYRYVLLLLPLHEYCQETMEEE
jgi:hypothetical protein